MSRTPPTRPSSGPVRLGPKARAALRPVVAAEVTSGFWHERRRVNAQVAIPQGPALLEDAGNLHNLRLVAGATQGSFVGDYPFQDTDVYKWLEAASWQLAQLTDDPQDELAAEVERIVALVAAAQQEDGYLNTWFQSGKGEGRYSDLRWGHELYCAGHLIQAAVAHHRATGREELLDVARRFADHIDATFGPEGSGRPLDTFDAHPEVETALVELHRETGERRYLDLAAYFVDRHGHGAHRLEVYCQDRVPLREAETVEGHAVRQLYLLAAAADLATETGEPALTEACVRLWHAMAATKTHLTGGVGAHHDKEDFGDPFELPNERAYCETCAAIASIQFGWRMALLTGRARYGDLVERTLFNGFLAGMSLDGESWLYVNPLQVRDGYVDVGGDQSSRRTRWFRCACCPPNVMRLLGSLEHYLASTDGRGLQLHQYASGRFEGEAYSQPVIVSVNTEYPWQGRIDVTVEQTPSRPWTLSLRVPQWCGRYRVAHGHDGPPVEGAVLDDGWLRIERAWEPGERVVLDLELQPRLVVADPRVDAARGCVAIERGPLVHCLEQVDHPGGGLDEVTVDLGVPLVVKERPELLGGVVTVVAGGHRRPLPAADWWPYRPAEAAGATEPADAVHPAAADGSAGATTEPGAATAAPPGVPLELTAVPYFAWANRGSGSMRVWLPSR